MAVLASFQAHGDRSVVDIVLQPAYLCAWCHGEFEGEFSHNLVRKVRWGFNPTPAIADNLGHPWFEERKDSWVRTCSNCHSARFARDWLDTADKGTIQGLEMEQEAKKIVQALYDEGLMIGQKDNRPAPPPPEADAPGAFFGLFHMNPGGFTYTEGWSELLKRYTGIQNENTRIRKMDALRKEVEMLKSKN